MAAQEPCSSQTLLLPKNEYNRGMYLGRMTKRVSREGGEVGESIPSAQNLLSVAPGRLPQASSLLPKYILDVQSTLHKCKTIATLWKTLFASSMSRALSIVHCQSLRWVRYCSDTSALCADPADQHRSTAPYRWETLHGKDKTDDQFCTKHEDQKTTHG